MRGIRHEDEPYVRVYTKDIIDWEMLSWQARTVYVMLQRKVDRAGILILGRHGIAGLAHTLKLPVEVVEVGLPGLISDEPPWIEQQENRLIVVEHIQAQETRKSDAQRQREKRERDHALARTKPKSSKSEVVSPTGQDGPAAESPGKGDRPPLHVTGRDTLSQIVTNSHPAELSSESGQPHDSMVTNRDTSSPDVTVSHDVTQDVTDCHSGIATLRNAPNAPTRLPDRARASNMNGNNSPPDPSPFDLARLEKCWSKQFSIIQPDNLTLVAEKLVNYASALGGTDPNDLIEPAVDAYAKHVEGMTENRRATMYCAEKFCESKHWAAVQQLLAGRPTASGSSGQGNGNGHREGGGKLQNWEVPEVKAAPPPNDVAARLRVLTGKGGGDGGE